MGNSNPKEVSRSQKLGDRKWQSMQSQFSTISNLSGYSNLSTNSRNYSRLSRSSRRGHLSRYNGTTGHHHHTNGHATNGHAEKFDQSKTAWPVSTVEALFLPEFPIKAEVNESSFRVEGQISRGSFGKVLKVKKKDTEKTYAMKVLSKSHIVRENAIDQCKYEVILQNRCGHHPFIMSCLFYWQSRKHLFIVMDYVPYGELRTLWKEHPKMPEAVVKVYIGEIAIAIDFIHSLGIIYRDLKMENILLDKDGHVQLIDFGLGKWLHVGARTSTICGTIQYMAPEILQGEPYSHSVDWWSLGIIMYVMLTGHFPVDGAILQHCKMADVVKKFDFSLPEECSLNAKSVTQKLLCKDPSRRLQSLKKLRWEPWFSDFSFDLALTKEISPKMILKDAMNEPSKNGDINGEITNLIEEFEDFSWTRSSKPTEL